MVDTWSVKDIMGNVTTWEIEAMDNVEPFLDLRLGEMRLHPDPDPFNEWTSVERRGITLVDVEHDLGETHSRLLNFLQNLPDSASIQ